MSERARAPRLALPGAVASRAASMKQSPKASPTAGRAFPNGKMEVLVPGTAVQLPPAVGQRASLALPMLMLIVGTVLGSILTKLLL